MEKASNTAVMEASFEWDDVGSWNSVAQHNRPDEHGNVALAQHAGIDTTDCILFSAESRSFDLEALDRHGGQDGHLLATIGLKNLIIVHTPDATLICDRRRAGDVKTLVERLRAQGREAYL